MDTTSIIILVFVMTIFTSLGGNSVHSPSSSKNFNQSNPTQVEAPSTPVAVDNSLAKTVNPSYFGVVGENPRDSIYTFIAKYRNEFQAQSITDALMRYSQQYDVNPKLVAALMSRESRFNPMAISSSGARGLGQLLPSTAQGLGVTNSFDIEENCMGTVRYVKYLLDRFNKYGDQVSFALASYLEGPNAVTRNKGYSTTTGRYVRDIIDSYYKI